MSWFLAMIRDNQQRLAKLGGLRIEWIADEA